MSPLPSKTLILALAALALLACDAEVEGGAILPELRVTDIGPSPILPGTRLTIEGSGFVVPEVATLGVVIRGAVDGRPVELAVAPQRVDDARLVVPVLGDVEAQILGDLQGTGRFVGTVTVVRIPSVDAAAEEASHTIDLNVARTLTPTVTGLSPETLWIGEEITVSGGGFLHANEGASVVQLDGTMTTTAPARTFAIQGLQVPAVPPDAARRDTLTLTLTPDVLGIVPGRFTGTVKVINQSHAGEVTESQTVPLGDVTLSPPVIDTLTPTQASRGQYITIDGRGFTAPDGLLQAATVLVLDGTFSPRAGGSQLLTGANALTLVPDVYIGNHTALAVLRVDVGPDGELTGLGLVPGVFEGTVAPLVLLGPDRVRGAGLPLTFEVLPQRQVVYIKLLPGFDEALARFGLLAERDAVRERILEVVTRDYDGVNVAFTYEVPEDFAEYGIVEVAGRDPNGTGLFGLDNTTGKDTDNQRFDDIIGGYNAETSADGYAAYGGVFPAEFMAFSGRLGDNPGKTPRFDDVFEAVAPELGGRPAERGEADGDSARAAAIREAVRVFGNLTGSTISHEVGHSLGLAAVAGQFHNIGDNPGWLMDSGSNRPFTERAELDGDGPSFFGVDSRRYLEAVLPIP